MQFHGISNKFLMIKVVDEPSEETHIVINIFHTL